MAKAEKTEPIDPYYALQVWCRDHGYPDIYNNPASVELERISAAIDAYWQSEDEQ